MARKKKATKAPARPKRKERKIAIFGTTPSRMTGPHQDDSGWERWTIGPGGKDAHGWERLFEIHQTWPDDFKEYIDDLKAVKPPQQVWTMAPLEGCEANFVYPKEAMLEKHGRRMWFSSSISYCIALAIEEHPTDIGLWGIDLESGEEYKSQWVGCVHLLDLARFVGINIHLPANCGLLRDFNPYPDRYETHFALYTENKKLWLEQQLNQQRPLYESIKASVHRLEGHVIQAKMRGVEGDELAAIEDELLQTNIQLGGISNTVQQLQGEMGAIEHMRRMFVYEFNDPNEMGISIAKS